MKSILDLLKIKSYRPKWFWCVIILLPTLFVIGLNGSRYSQPLDSSFNQSEINSLPNEGRGPASIPIEVEADSPIWNLSVPQFAMIFSVGCFIVSVLILLLTIPVYIFSGDTNKSMKAGGLAKTCLQFLFASGTAVLATLSFV